MAEYFDFGEIVIGYNEKVFNEREIRASAGILFFFAIVSFMNAWLSGNFEPTKIFVIAFLIDFSIRIFINPRYSPSIVLGRWIVNNQKPEYTGAAQKRWAWVFGLILAISMFYLVVLNDIKGPINLLICSLCLLLLFFESAFGICLGCKLYAIAHKDKVQNCPGSVCEIIEKEEIQKINLWQSIIFVVFIIFLYGIVKLNVLEMVKETTNKESLESSVIVQEPNKECEPPQWAIDMGHREQWKLHHGCK